LSFDKDSREEEEREEGDFWRYVIGR
jgi:hypothetical protein